MTNTIKLEVVVKAWTFRFRKLDFFGLEKIQNRVP